MPSTIQQIQTNPLYKVFRAQMTQGPLTEPHTRNEEEKRGGVLIDVNESLVTGLKRRWQRLTIYSGSSGRMTDYYTLPSPSLRGYPWLKEENCRKRLYIVQGRLLYMVQNSNQVRIPRHRLLFYKIC